MTHVTEDGEDDAASENGGEGVDAGDVRAIADKVSVVLVVGPQRRHAAESATERVEDLSPGIDPNLEKRERKGEKSRGSGFFVVFTFHIFI